MFLQNYEKDLVAAVYSEIRRMTVSKVALVRYIKPLMQGALSECRRKGSYASLSCCKES